MTSQNGICGKKSFVLKFGCKDKGLRKTEFVAKTQFHCNIRKEKRKKSKKE